MAIVAAVTLLIIVTAIVAWIIFGSIGSNDDQTSASASPASATQVAGAATPEASPTSAMTMAPTQPSVTPTPPSETGPTPAATAARTPAPTPQVTPTSVPRTQPAVGDFGDLPPGDVPSGTSVQRPLSLDYAIDMSMQQVPKEGPVYQLQPRTWTREQATNLARALGVTGNVTDQGGGSFRVSGGGDLYISDGLVQYIGGPAGPATPDTAQLPADDALVQAARSWLIKHNLVGANIGSGTVVSRDEASRQALVRVKPSEPASILSAIPAATVTISGSGTIVEANVRWPEGMPRSTYGFRSAAELWEDASQGKGYVEIPAESLPSGSGALTGKVTITGTSLAYTTAGAPGDDQYLVPLVVFTGQATVSGAQAPVPVKIYVAAVSAQTAPRG